MVERIKHILKQEGLSASQLADRMHVQRSNLSHILSGRNQPSLDFVKKLLNTFPKYNSDWLLFGTGNEIHNSEFSREYTNGNKPHMFTESTNVNYPTPDREFTTVYSFAEKATEINIPPVDFKSVKPDVEKNTEKQSAPTRKIKKIILIYDNATFEELLNIDKRI